MLKYCCQKCSATNNTRNLQTTKKCNRCKETKPLTEFYIYKRSADGRGYSCKLCVCKKTLQWQKDNLDRHRINSARYNRNSRARNPEPYLVRERRWKKKNPEKARIAQERYKMQKKSAFVEDVDKIKVFESNGWVCQLCYKPVDKELPWPHPYSKSLDHIRPLSKGGMHSYANVQLAHLRCNISKLAKWDEDITASL